MGSANKYAAKNKMLCCLNFFTIQKKEFFFVYDNCGDLKNVNGNQKYDMMHHAHSTKQKKPLRKI